MLNQGDVGISAYRRHSVIQDQRLHSTQSSGRPSLFITLFLGQDVLGESNLFVPDTLYCKPDTLYCKFEVTFVGACRKFKLTLILDQQKFVHIVKPIEKNILFFYPPPHQPGSLVLCS